MTKVFLLIILVLLTLIACESGKSLFSNLRKIKCNFILTLQYKFIYYIYVCINKNVLIIKLTKSYGKIKFKKRLSGEWTRFVGDWLW